MEIRVDRRRKRRWEKSGSRLGGGVGWKKEDEEKEGEGRGRVRGGGGKRGGERRRRRRDRQHCCRWLLTSHGKR
ncbi:hypothetical protein HZH68_013361 [Vespula germanica]|uniref:Uncharacterized protein n=1 Tax=Vespula germanica TaxID=30212 RepID=A0A834JD86_VESGE|nr:hypothetical protein HZH68_013361 [Vespula germanica]